MCADVFISYSRADGPFVQRLDAMLTAGGVNTWFDQHSLRPGQRWEDVIDDEIRAATVFLTCLSDGAQNERGYFQAEQRKAAEAAMQVPSNQLFIVPVLLGECELPRELHQYHTVNLAEEGAIESLLASLSYALGRPVSAPQDAIAALRRALASCFHFSDDLVRKVAMRLGDLDPARNSREFLAELDALFERKTFRFESMRGCPEQRWADRLDSAYQTLKVFQQHMPDMRRALPEEKYRNYRDVVMEMERYCMQMGANLFEADVDYERIAPHIGKPTFKAQLPAEKRFDVDAAKQPIIDDAVNDAVDSHRVRAVELMDQLRAGG